MKQLLQVLCLFIFCNVVYAHQNSDSFVNLTLEQKTLYGRWDIAIRDLSLLFRIDINRDGKISWGELKAQRTYLEDILQRELKISRGNKNCRNELHNLKVNEHINGVYIVLLFESECESSSVDVGVDYSFLFNIDARHKGLFTLKNSDNTYTAIFSKQSPKVEFALNETNSELDKLLRYVGEGVWHIWIGYDHVLFLICLLLPAVFVRKGKNWEVESSQRAIITDVVKVVSAFTAAHSLSMFFMLQKLLVVSTTWVEVGIALSVVLAALNNIFPVVTRYRWALGLVFGFIHGLGFASILSGLLMDESSLLISLLGFNIGVELGQLAIVLLLVPMIYLLRYRKLYRRVALPLGSGITAVLACTWVLQRLAII